MYCKLKRWYKKNGGRSRTSSKYENGKTKAKTTRIFKQIDEHKELREFEQKIVYKKYDTIKMPNDMKMPDSMMSNYSEIQKKQKSIQIERES